MGRRLPWVLGGAAAGVVAMLLLAGADSVLGMVLGWALAQAGLNAMLAAVTATVPDQVPTRQRGVVGGVARDRPDPRGRSCGSGIAAATGSIAAGYLAIAVVLVATDAARTASTAATSRCPTERDRRSRWAPSCAPSGSSPRQHPDFAWAWVTRFLMNLGNALLSSTSSTTSRTPSTSRRRGRGRRLRADRGLRRRHRRDGLRRRLWSDRVGRRKVFVIVLGRWSPRRRCCSSRFVPDLAGASSAPSCSASASGSTRPSTSR